MGNRGGPRGLFHSAGRHEMASGGGPDLFHVKQDLHLRLQGHVVTPQTQHG
jgi:hypothetical protein